MADRLRRIRPLQSALTRPARARRRARQEAALLDVVRSLTDPGDLVFDVGAHRGEMTALFLQADARVVAVEPQPGLADALERRYRDEGRVAVVAKGLAEAPGLREMALSSETTLSTMEPDWQVAVKSSGRFGGAAWESMIEVDVTTLDSLIAEYGKPAFIKIDVEGFEPHVLGGLSLPVGAVSFAFIRERMEATAHCVELLNDLGLTEFNFSDGFAGPALVAAEWLGKDALMETLGGLSNPLAMGDVYARLPAAGLNDSLGPRG